MNSFTFTKLGRTLLLAAVVAVGSVCWLGCGGDDGGGDDNGGKDNGGGLDSKLVCADGEAWIDQEDAYYGVVFKSNGDMWSVGKYDGVWKKDEGGKWKTNGNTLTITFDGGQLVHTYNVTGNQLKITHDGSTETFTKTSGVNIGVNNNNNNNNNNGGNNTVVKGTFTDSRDGRTYKTVKIGTQTWMAENLDYQKASGFGCYGGDPANCTKYGRWYTWDEAKMACPSGWHLPSRDEWDRLAESVGGTKSSDYETWHKWDGAGKKLKAKSGWENTDDGNNGNGTDDFGFSALPGGFVDSRSSFYIGTGGYWWTSDSRGVDKYYNDNAYHRSLESGSDKLFDYFNTKSVGESVRCVK